MPLWVVCGVNVSSCRGLCCSSMQHIYSPYLRSYNFTIHFIFISTFLRQRACMCSRVCVCLCCARLCVRAVALSPGQALDTVLAGDTVCGFSSWSCCSGGRERCVPPKPPASPLHLPHPPPPPSPSANRPTPRSPLPGPQRLGCGLWMSATSWLSAQGLAGDWPVVEVQYQALSVSSSFHFLPPLGAAWAAVSGANIL